jgi:hypothetical protein
MTVAPARLARQPSLGLAGLALVVPVAVLLGAGLGSLERSLLVLGPISTFALPVIAMIAFWWHGWPGTRLRAPLSGLTDTLLVVVAGGVVLTIAGQTLVAHVDLRGVFDPTAPSGHAPTFPATMPFAGAVFVAMLHLTLVCEGWALRRYDPIAAGVAVLVLSWAAGAALYVGLVRDGAISAGAFGDAFVSIGALQVVFWVVLDGRPFAAIARRGPRLAAGNAVVVACGCLASRVVDPALAGCVVAAGLVVGMLFEGWLESPGANLIAVAVLTVALRAGLQAIADAGTWKTAEPDEWTAYAALNAIGAGIILHVAIGRRWPFAPPA